MKRMILLCTLAAVCVVLSGCGSGGKTKERSAATSSAEIQFAMPEEGETVAVLTTASGDICIRLYPQYAPLAVQNFIGLAQQGYYNGVSFHRILEDFIVQTGDASGTGGTTIWNGTAFPVEISDKLHHYTGAVAMAHPSGDTASNTSQFYIVQTPQNSVSKSAAQALVELGLRQEVANAYRDVGGAPYLDNLYTVFGQVYQGMDIVDEIAQAKCDQNGQPLTPVLIDSVTITQYTAPVATASDTANSPSDAAPSTATDSTEPAA